MSPVDAAWIEAAIGSLAPDEKARLTAGLDQWRTVPVDRLGIPSLKVTDGPNGARGDGVSGARSASFPAGVALAATWNPELVFEVGEALAAEVRDKGARILLGPTVNLHRSPLGGRNFECFSEDPLLTARLATAYIDGLQSQGVGACLKHLVANDSEFERFTISSEVDERTLRELYLVPFEHAVAHARPWSIMAAYNRINGTYACEHDHLLNQVLKDEWGFDGLVVSDWHAVHDGVRAANGGCDLEMPGPGRHLGAPLAAAVAQGAVDAAVVDDKVRRLLRTIARTDLRAAGAVDEAAAADTREQSVDRPEHRALIRRAGAEATVLLKNLRRSQVGARTLPFADDEGIRTIAVIGPNAVVGTFQGGGSATVTPHRVVHPLEAITARAARAGIEVVHDRGGSNARYLDDPDASLLMPYDDEGRGWQITYVDGDDPDGDAVATRLVRRVSHLWWEAPSPVADAARWSARWTARVVAPADGTYLVSVAATGRSRVLVDGAVVVDNWTAPEPGELLVGQGSREVRAELELSEGTVHEVRVEFARTGPAGLDAVRFGLEAVPEKGEIRRAVDLAREADAAVVIVGTTTDWESEGADRTSMTLPGRQDDLVRRIAEANPRTVAVLNTGGPVELPWAPVVPAILQIWFPGEELGSALADVLFGDADPGGRLPTTFPLRYEDHPALFGYPGEGGEVRYGEGVFVGYRAYTTRRQPVAFPFGHGLSYTTFSYGEPDVAVVDPPTAPAGGFAPGAARRPPVLFRIGVTVTNTGDRTGHEVTQLYVRPPAGPLLRPDRELKGFVKSTLAPGASTRVELDLDVRSFAAFDGALGAWRAEAGDYELLIGSGDHLPARAVVMLPETLVLPLR